MELWPYPQRWFPHGVTRHLSQNHPEPVIKKELWTPWQIHWIWLRGWGWGLTQHWTKSPHRFRHTAVKHPLTEKKVSIQILNELPEVSYLVGGRVGPPGNDYWHLSTHFYLKYPIAWSNSVARTIRLNTSLCWENEFAIFNASVK